MARSNLPFVSSNIPPDLRQFLDRVRESLDGDTYVRRTDYIYGTVPRRPGEPSNPGDPGEPPTPPKPPCGDPVTPTAPTGFEVAAGFSGFLLSWQMPAYCGHDHTEVYALRRNGGASELSEVNRIGDSRGVMYSHIVNQADDYWCFWIRHVNTAGVRGPFNDTPGTCARTAIPPEVLIDALKGRITESQLYKHLGDRINLIELTKTAVEMETLVREEGDNKLAVRVDTVSAVADDAKAGVTDITTARIGYCTKNGATTADPDKATCVANGGSWNVGLPWATAVKQVSVTYNGQSVALEQQFNAIASDVNGLEAQYTVKIDNNGYVSGFGLASTPVNGVPFSDFIIRADRFSIGAPANPDAGYQNDPSIPFIVTTTGQTINGVYVPPGTYIKDAYIQNGTITNAKIANATINDAKIITLTASKLTAGSIRVDACIGSSNFVSGSTGWQVCGNGNAEFNNVTVRGTVVSSTVRSTNATGISAGDGFWLSTSGDMRVGSANALTGPRLTVSTSDKTVNIALPCGGVAKTVMNFGATPGSSYLQSCDYVAGTSGWAVKGNGNAEFNNLLARGTLRSTNWNGALNNGVIAANGTQGWVIDKNGNAEFDSIHLRKGAVSEMGWTAPVAGAGVSFGYPSNVTQWSATAPYQIGAVVWYQHRTKLYQCQVAHVNKAPPNLTYWSEYGYKTLATLVVPGDPFALAPAGLGMMFYARTVFSAAVRYSLGSPLSRVVQKGSVSPYVPAGDVAVRLVRVAPNGAVTTYVEGGLALACCGRAESMTESGELDWFYSLPFTSFEYVSTTPGTFWLEAKSMVLTNLVTIHAGGTALGFIGTKR